MEHRDMQEFSFSDIRVHPSLITDLLNKSEDVELMLRREGDRVTVSSNRTDTKAETGQITLENLVEKTVSILRHFEENADSIMSELKPGKCSGLLEVMNRLAKRMDALNNETDLLTIANIVYDLTVEIPHCPPNDEPPRHFRPEDLKRENSRCRIESYKATLAEAFPPCFKRIEQAWWDKPSRIPETASKGAKETPWHMMGMFKDDPTWGEMFDEIEKERDRNLISTGAQEKTEKISLKDLVEKTVSILRHFEENADSIMGDLEPGWDSGLLEVMNRLAKRMDAIENESDLLTIANIVYDLTVEIPHFPPDDEPPRHFRPEDLKRENSRIESYKATLMEAFTPCFKRIEQAWRDLPSIIPETASKGPKEPDWELIRSLKDDPSWDEFFEEIERERDKDIWTGEETL